ncbi:MAG: transglutaminase domain-containing protein, partial [Bacteroidaceae bacterium]|nr:transglutaminase domain-containing protein [Bacteroidaceae bacterium]
MKGHIIYLLIFILIGALPSHAQIISDTRYDFSDVALQITDGAHTPTEVARKIYQWICEHIAYDTDYLYYTADECWENKRAVCQGYCELYYYMGKAVGLET